MHTLSDLINSDEAVSNVVAYILIFGMVVIMVGLIFIVGMPSIEDAQERAYIESIKHGIKVFDSKASMVALGESPSQRMSIDYKGGIFEMNEHASNITIVMNATNTPIFEGTLGTLTYELDGTVIAYEGGGVWMQYPTGDSVMLSPPEFHYNYETLTLPIIRLHGNDATSGTGTVQFKVDKNNNQIRYPNMSENISFVNPVAGHKDVQVIIQSDYYKAWAKYFEERTDAIPYINPDSSKREVTAILNIKPSDIHVNLTEPLTVYGISKNMTDPIEVFEFNLTDPDTSLMHNLDLEFRTTDGLKPQLIIGFVWLGKFLTTITYIDADNKQESWVSEFDESGKKFNMEFDMLADVDAKYKTAQDTKSWGNDTSSYEPGLDYEQNDITTLNNVTQHYMAIMPAPFTFDAYNKGKCVDPGPCEGSDSKLSFPISTVSLKYNVPPPKLSYLHIVEHDITVEIH